MMVVLQNGNV